jgi:hypothetical protein
MDDWVALKIERLSDGDRAALERHVAALSDDTREAVT